jgi:hypothetical protein
VISTARLPIEVADALRAANSHDAAAFSECFHVGAVLDAWGMLFEGRALVATWAQKWVVSYEVQFTDLLHLWDEDRIAVHAQVRGTGYQGPATLTFQSADGLITALRITS